jgi:hypothetical protein
MRCHARPYASRRTANEDRKYHLAAFFPEVRAVPDRDHPSKSNGHNLRIAENSADASQHQSLAKSMAHGISPEASQAAKLMLDRLKKLSKMSDGGSVETSAITYFPC